VRGGGFKGAGGFNALYQFSDLGGGQGGGTAVLSLDTALHRAPAPVLSGLSDHYHDARGRLAELDLVVDLGVRIGSREWFRGFATCGALCWAAWSFAPGLEPLPGISPAPLPEAHWEEARALAIAPLAYGGDTGRRMAATDAVVPLAETPERPRIDIVATLGRGDGFGRVLERAGIAEVEADQVSEMVARVLPLSDIRAGTPMEITLGRRPNKRVARPLESLAFRARFDLKLTVERIDGRLVLTRVPIAVDNTPLRIQGRVGASLYRSARAAGAPPKAVEAFIRALSTQLNIGSDVHGEDRFDIIVEHRRAATGETESGKLLFAGLVRPRGKDLQLMEWTQGGRSQWFEASGVGRESGTLMQPVPGAISSNYGLRMHPILGYSRMHRGVDFRAAHGTPIVAATDGRVTLAGWNGGYGRTVRINHAGGLTTLYAHMSRMTVKNGDQVRRGQVIGYVGSTGLSTGPHLHYELYRNGQHVNPRSVRFVTRAQLSGAELASFRSRLRSLLATPAGGVKKEEAKPAAD
jgi:murein DD-endopeptidase MepM/ murein hydrolase activator NlpD